MRSKLTALLIIAGLMLPAYGAENPDVRGGAIGAPDTEQQDDTPVPSLDDVLKKPKTDPAAGIFGGKPKAEPKKTVDEDVTPVSELPRTKDGKYVKLNFSYISDYDYITPDPFSPNPPEVPEDQIPGHIKGLDDVDAVIVGYMMPVAVTKQGDVKEFILVKDQSLCCFGVPPAINAWVGGVTEESGPVKFYSDMPIAVFGTFDVGEETEDGYVVSLYRMNVHRVIDVRQLMKEME